MTVKKYQIKDLIDKLQRLVEEMEDKELEEVSTNCNTYGMKNYVCFGYNGYLQTDYDKIEILSEEDY